MSDELKARIIELESLVAHLQHDFEQLNDVVVRQQSELKDLKRQIGRLEGELEQFLQEPEKRDPLAERPPHY